MRDELHTGYVVWRGRRAISAHFPAAISPNAPNGNTELLGQTILAQHYGFGELLRQDLRGLLVPNASRCRKRRKEIRDNQALVPEIVNIFWRAHCLAAALALSIIGFGSLVGRILMGFVQDRIGARLSMILCLLIMGLSLALLLALLPLARTDAALFAFAVLFGFAFGGDVPQVPALTVRCFGVSALGVVYGTISAVVNVGSGLAPAAAGYIFDWAGSYTAAFLGASILLFFGAGAIFRIR